MEILTISLWEIKFFNNKIPRKTGTWEYNAVVGAW